MDTRGGYTGHWMCHMLFFYLFWHWNSTRTIPCIVLRKSVRNTTRYWIKNQYFLAWNQKPVTPNKSISGQLSSLFVQSRIRWLYFSVWGFNNHLNRHTNCCILSFYIWCWWVIRYARVKPSAEDYCQRRTIIALGGTQTYKKLETQYEVILNLDRKQKAKTANNNH